MSPRLLAALLSVGLVACTPAGDTVHGGGQVTVRVSREEADPVDLSWDLLGLSEGDLELRAQDWEGPWPDCTPGPGAWLRVDSYLPEELRACGEDLSLVLNFGDAPTGTSRAVYSDVQLRLAEDAAGGEGWSIMNVSWDAKVIIADTGISGSFFDEGATFVDGTGRGQVVLLEIAWAMDPDLWILLN
ncbi:MAG: hypothetical protein RIT28_350 [Pseudomonadota bacterium]